MIIQEPRTPSLFFEISLQSGNRMAGSWQVYGRFFHLFYSEKPNKHDMNTP